MNSHQRDLVVPTDAFGGNGAEFNRQAKLWGIEVDGRLHSDTQACWRSASNKSVN